MYEDLAFLWPLISPPEGYAEEAAHWREAVRRHLGPGRHEVLELGVGGGNNLSHLTRDFQATAVDLSPAMMAHSMRLNPGVEHHVGDMRTVRLGRFFSAVLIHDAVDYLMTEEDMRATFDTARAHLTPGGVLVTAPDWFSETFPGTWASHQVNRAGGRELTYFEYGHLLDAHTIETLFYFLWKENGGLRVEQDRHFTGLFPLETWQRLMAEAGFKVEKRPYPVHEDRHEAYLLVGIAAG